jgi:hypothetical protein
LDEWGDLVIQAMNNPCDHCNNAKIVEKLGNIAIGKMPKF